MTRRVPTLAIIFVVGVAGILLAWILNPYIVEKPSGDLKFYSENMDEKKKLVSTTVDGIEITWLGHSGFKLKKDETVVYIDPYKNERGEKGNLVVITHDHFDHLDVPSILALSDGNTIIVTTIKGAQKIPQGAYEVRPFNIGQTFNYLGVELRSVPAYNLNKPYHPKDEGMGFVLNWNNTTFYHAGDTDKIPEMEHLGPIAVAMLPIGGTFTMSEAEAADAVRIIKPRVVIPMHYGTLPETPGNPQGFKEIVGDAAEVRILE